MPIQTVTKTIGDTDFQVTQMGFSASRKTLVRLLQLAGPTLRSLLSDVLGQIQKAGTKADTPEGRSKLIADTLGKLDVQRVMDGVIGFVEGLKDEDLEYLANTFGERTLFSPAGSDKFIKFDREARELHFGGDGLYDFFRWLAFCLEVNYRGFFSKSSNLQELGQRLIQPNKPA